MKEVELIITQENINLLKNLIGKKLVSISVDDSINTFAMHHTSNFAIYDSPVFNFENENIQIALYEEPISFYGEMYDDENYLDDEFVNFSFQKDVAWGNDIQILKINEKITDILIVQDNYHVWGANGIDINLKNDIALIFEFESKRIIFQKGDIFSDYFDVTYQNINSKYKISLNPYDLKQKDKSYDCGRIMYSLGNENRVQSLIVEKANFNLFTLKWNPNISSYTMKSHNKVLDKRRKGHFLGSSNWSVYEWQKLKPGDMYILLQVGTENDGIAKIGRFTSLPYGGRSWRKDGSKVYYADMLVLDAFETEHNATLPANLFESEFPELNWHGGHSGELIDSKTAEKLLSKIETELLNKKYWDNDKLEEFRDDSDYWMDKDDEEETDPVGTQSHGDHWVTVFDNYKLAGNLIARIDQGKIISEKIQKTNQSDSGEAIFIQRQQVQPSDKDSLTPIIASRAVYMKSPIDKNFFREDAFPVILNGVNVNLTVAHIEEWNNCIEAIITGITSGGTEIKFFDSNYAKYKDSYVIGQQYEFKISALAYSAKVIEKDLEYGYSLMQFDPYFVEDGEYADSVSNVKNYSWNGKEFFRFEINIPGGEREEKIYLPIIASKNEMNKNLKDGDFVKGYCWVMGERG